VGRQLILAHRYGVGGEDCRDGHTDSANQKKGEPDAATDSPYLRPDCHEQTEAANARDRNSSTIRQPWRPISYSLILRYEGSSSGLITCRVASKTRNTVAAPNHKRAAVSGIAVIDLAVGITSVTRSTLCIRWFYGDSTWAAISAESVRYSTSLLRREARLSAVPSPSICGPSRAPPR
jgi:hypothetical protein